MDSWISIRATKKKKKKNNPFSLRKRFEQLIGNKRTNIQFSSDSSSNEQTNSSQIFVYSVRRIHQNDSISKGMLVEKTVAWALRQITCGLNFRLSMKLLSFDLIYSIFTRQFNPLCHHQPAFSTTLSLSLKSYTYPQIYVHNFFFFSSFRFCQMTFQRGFRY